jgi:hypothetical protein
VSQRTVVIGLLRQAGDKGVSVHDLVYRRGITRAAAIIHGLRHDEGMDIETVPGAPLEDGRTGLARYVLHDKPRDHMLGEDTVRVEATPEGFTIGPARPIEFDCGCVRSGDGRSWTQRCEKHEGVSA